MEMKTIPMRVSLSEMQLHLGARVQFIADLVSTGLYQGESLKRWHQPDVTGNIVYGYGRRPNWTEDSVREAWLTWILRSGFRDLAELLSEALESLQQVLAGWELQTQKANDGVIAGEDWNGVVVGRFKKFHRLGFPPKVEYLERQYGFQVPDSSLDLWKSIVAVRNCLVHRNGLVQGADLQDGEELLLKWFAHVPLLKTDTGPQEVELGTSLPGGSRLSVGSQNRERRYSAGDRIALTPAEFREIAWTVNRTLSQAIRSMETHGRSMGVEFKSARRSQSEEE